MIKTFGNAANKFRQLFCLTYDIVSYYRGRNTDPEAQVLYFEAG
jgi:hypothetical protein